MTRVLVVDDHDDGREMLALIVASHGYAVTAAANGREAIEQARRERPDVIVMDLFMPEMDGYEAARALKADPALAAVPIVAYTARTGPPDFDAALFADLCVKPCHPGELLQKLERVLRPTSLPPTV